jgi:predicted DsbA family dithiol-disulfide isomerase
VGEAAAVLADERFVGAVLKEHQPWLVRNVQEVPTFVFNDRYTVPGAQETDTFVRILNRIRGGSGNQLRE